MNAVISSTMAGNMTNQRGYESMAPLGKLTEVSLVESSEPRRDHESDTIAADYETAIGEQNTLTPRSA